MKVIVVGSGYVGLVHAAVCSEYGHEVIAYDVDRNKVEAFRDGDGARIESFIKEPGLTSIICTNRGRSLFFSSNLESIFEGTDAVFLCLPTPPNLDGSTNLTWYDEAIAGLAAVAARRKDQRRVVFVNKSTVPIGTARHLEAVMREHGVPNFGVASNPEFLAEGSAVGQARRPDRVVVGCDDEADFKILRRVYSQFVNHVRIKYIETTPETAEAIKYVANTMLLTYISFWNGVGARIGEKWDKVNLDQLRLGVTADDRISTWGSYVSNGAGGSCFGKDIASLIHQMRLRNADTKLLEAAREVNEYQKVYLVERAIHEAGFDFNNKTVAVLGLAFKKRTDDMRDASSIRVIEALLGKGAAGIRAYDPLARESAARELTPARNALFAKIEYCDTAADAIAGTHAAVISSDCEEFRGLSRVFEDAVAPPYLIIDGRRMIPDRDELTARGYSYLAVGSALAQAA
jgi:UDPglucose 6-dehydrogenase